MATLNPDLLDTTTRLALTLPHTAGPCGSPVHATPVQVAWVAAQELDAHGYAESAHDARQTALTWLAQQKDVTPADRILEARLLLESGAAPAAQRLLLELAPFEDLESLAVTGMVAAACGFDINYLNVVFKDETGITLYKKRVMNASVSVAEGSVERRSCLRTLRSTRRKLSSMLKIFSDRPRPC